MKPALYKAGSGPVEDLGHAFFTRMLIHGTPSQGLVCISFHFHILFHSGNTRTTPEWCRPQSAGQVSRAVDELAIRGDKRQSDAGVASTLA
ncbi:hypothetical protein D3C76_1652630 [compost metagenome]